MRCAWRVAFGLVRAGFLGLSVVTYFAYKIMADDSTGGFRPTFDTILERERERAADLQAILLSMTQPPPESEQRDQPSSLQGAGTTGAAPPSAFTIPDLSLALVQNAVW